jgi:hypothetical protein
LKDDGVDIDLPSREKIEGVLKYLKTNKVAGMDSIAAELLKNGEPNLVDALHELIQQAWTSKTLPRHYFFIFSSSKSLRIYISPLKSKTNRIGFCYISE